MGGFHQAYSEYAKAREEDDEDNSFFKRCDYERSKLTAQEELAFISKSKKYSIIVYVHEDGRQMFCYE